MFNIFLSLLQNGQKNVRMSEFQTLSEDGSRVDPNSERLLLEIPQPFPNHHGGQVFVTRLIFYLNIKYSMICFTLFLALCGDTVLGNSQ